MFGRTKLNTYYIPVDWTNFKQHIDFQHCANGGLSAVCVYTFGHQAVSMVVPGTAAVRRRRQSMKPPVEVKSMSHRPAADCAPCRRRR